MKRTATILMISFAIALMLNAIPVSYGYVQEKTYKMNGDGYIQGKAKINCWQYTGDIPKVDIRVDVLKAFHAKGRNLLSAYIIDLAKNGPESYLQIGKAKFSNDKYDYVGFSQQFTGKDFPAAGDAIACPIDSIGRIVVVIGTSPPSDSDTLSKGAVDIIAEVALSTPNAESKNTTDDTSTSIGKEESEVGAEEPEVEAEVEVEAEKPEIKVVPYSISKPKLADPFGDRIEEIVTGQPVLVQTKVTNNLDEQQPFVYILQVKDSEGFTVMLTWIKGTMSASAALDAGISWTPEEKGNYTVEVFVWKSLEDPGSPLTKSIMVSVGE